MSQQKQYIATKIVTAMPATKGECYDALGRVYSGDGAEPGYRVWYPDGYSSWCPKAEFEKHNRECAAMNFGLALEALKQGKRVAREGWNGKGMWLRTVNPYLDKEFEIRENGPVNGVDSGTLLPWIGMHTADNGFVPWLASQTDMLADDWSITAAHAARKENHG